MLLFSCCVISYLLRHFALVFFSSEQALLPPDQKPLGSCGHINQLWPRSAPLTGIEVGLEGRVSSTVNVPYVCICACVSIVPAWACMYERNHCMWENSFQIPVWMLNIVLFGCDGSNDLKPAWMRMNRLWSDSTAFRLYSSLPFFIVVLFLKMWFHYLFSCWTGHIKCCTVTNAWDYFG